MKNKFYSIGYFIKLAFKGLIKNSVMTIAAIIVLLSCLVVTGAVWLLNVNINENLDSIDGYNKVTVLLEHDLQDYTIDDIENRLNSLSGVTQVVYVSSEQYLEEQINKYGDYKDIFDMFKDDNPLRDSFRISFESAESAETLIYQMENIEGVYKVNKNLEISQKIEDIQGAVSIILSSLMVLLLIVAFFIIMNTVKLSVFARREEIGIMRIVGATRFFIACPYIFEGIFLGAVSALGAFSLEYLIYKNLVLDMLSEYSWIQIIPFEEFGVGILSAFLLIGILTGVLGSLFSLRRYNKG